MKLPLSTRAIVLSGILFLVFVAVWEISIGGGTKVANMDPEYAKLMGATAKGASAMPGPLKVGDQIWQHIINPFYDKGPNDKGVGIQLAYSIARVMVGFVSAALIAVPLGFLIGQTIARGPQIRYSTSMGHDGTSSSE